MSELHLRDMGASAVLTGRLLVGGVTVGSDVHIFVQFGLRTDTAVVLAAIQHQLLRSVS